MADSAAPRMPPRSEPPATDEVDSGWLSDESAPVKPVASAESVAAVSSDTTRSSVPPDSRASSVSPSFGAESPSSTPPPRAPARSKRGAPSWVLVGLVLVAVTGLWLAFQRGNALPTASQQATPAPAQAAPPVAVTPESEPAPPVVTATAPEPAPPAAPDPLPAATGAEGPEVAPVPPSVPAPVASQVTVTVHVVPPEARLFHKGKAAGSSGVVLTLEQGERRVFEVGSPGYVTRKLVVDGSSPKVRVVLRPEPSAAP